jgi:hypothetical protein
VRRPKPTIRSKLVACDAPEALTRRRCETRAGSGAQRRSPSAKTKNKVKTMATGTTNPAPPSTQSADLVLEEDDEFEEFEQGTIFLCHRRARHSSCSCFQNWTTEMRRQTRTCRPGRFENSFELAIITPDLSRPGRAETSCAGVMRTPFLQDDWDDDVPDDDFTKQLREELEKSSAVAKQ